LYRHRGSDEMILDRFRQLLALEHVSTRVLPPQEELLQLEDDTWEGEIDWNNGRDHVTIAFVASAKGPGAMHRSQINSAIQKLESLEAIAKEALRRHAPIGIAAELFTLFAFDVGDVSDLEVGRFDLSFSHPDDPDGFFNVHFDNWVVDTVVRND
jgi:hypothetical protein